MKTKYYEIVDVTFDEEILKRKSMPQQLKIKTPEYFEFMDKYCKTRADNIRNNPWLYQNIPDNLEGELKYKDKKWDYMDAEFFRYGLLAAVSEKVKDIFEDLNISKDEYVMKPILDRRYGIQYYLLFAYVIPISELIYPDSVFYEWLKEDVRIQFQSYEERMKALNEKKTFFPIWKTVLPKKYAQRDIILMEDASHSNPYFSERIINAFKERKVLGYRLKFGSRERIDFK